LTDEDEVPAASSQAEDRNHGLAAVLWVPMTLFLIFFSERFTERQMAGFALVNMVMAMTVLVWSFRTWVQRIK